MGTSYIQAFFSQVFRNPTLLVFCLSVQRGGAPQSIQCPTSHTHTPPPLLPPAAQVFAAARKAGYIPEGVKIDHVGFGLVLGEDGKKFRSRSGDVSGGGAGVGVVVVPFFGCGLQRCKVLRLPEG